MATIYGRLHPLDYLGAPIDDRLVMDRVVNEAAQHTQDILHFYVGLIWLALTGNHLDWESLKPPDPKTVPRLKVTDHRQPTDPPPEPSTHS